MQKKLQIKMFLWLCRPKTNGGIYEKRVDEVEMRKFKQFINISGGATRETQRGKPPP